MTDARLWPLAAGAAAYAGARFVEAYGLWRARRWAEWFSAVKAGAFIINAIILAYVARSLWLGRRR